MGKYRFLAVLACAVAALAATNAGSAAPLTSYTDATGDSGTSIDITSITVTNDPGGLIAFKISVANRSGGLNADDLIAVGIDSDRTPSTGDQDGDEYVVALGAGGAAIVKWDGTTYVTYAHGPVSGSFSAGVAEIGIDKATLGGVASFSFYALAFVDTETSTDHDVAPENGDFTYTLTVPEVDSARASFTSSAPRAGASFGVTGVALSLTDKSTTRATTYSCTAKLAGKALKPTSRCKWKLPPTSKGKKLVVTVSVTYNKRTTTFDPWMFRVH